MKMNVSISIRHHMDCAGCGKEITGTTLKWAYFWLLLHVQTCSEITKAPPLLRTLWGLWRWKQ